MTRLNALPSKRTKTSSRAPAIVSPKAGRTVPYFDIPEDKRRVFRYPSEFGRKLLGIGLTDKQAEIVDAFAPTRSAVSGVFCNEAGKTTKIITTLVLWHVCCFPRRGENGGVIATSGSWSQIVNQLMPSLRGFAHKFRKWEFQDREIKRDGIPNFMCFSTAQPGRAEGFHGQPETPLMALVDEAKSVKDDIFRVIEERCRPQRTGFLSSPGYSVGKFYESHTTAAASYRRFSMTVDDCQWIDRPEMRRLVEKAGGGDYERGLQDPLIQSAYFAKFMPFVEGSLISLADIEECLADPPPPKPGERHVRLDFAAGGDENTIGVRCGNRVWLEDCWREKNTMSATGRFMVKLEKLKREIGLRPEEVEGDADGLGKVMCDRIREVGWGILDYHANSTAFAPEKFRNIASEEWFDGTEAIQQKRFLIPDDAELKGQLVDRQGKYESSGLRWIESKDDMFRRQIRDKRPKRSPDRADAVLGAMAALPRGGSLSTSFSSGTPRSPWHDDPDLGPLLSRQEREGQFSVPEEVLQGLDAGG